MYETRYHLRSRLTAVEREQLQAGLRSADTFALRRSQILLASAGRQTPAVIARNLGGPARSVRNAVHAFAAEGLDGLTEKSSAPSPPAGAGRSLR